MSEPVSEAAGPVEATATPDHADATADRAGPAGASGGVGTYLALQGRAGNQATSTVVQAQLTVGPAGDRYEDEADRVATEVVRHLQRQPAGPPPDDATGSPPAAVSPVRPIRRIVQAKHDEPTIGLEGGALDAGTDAAINRARGGGAPLAEPVRQKMEAGFGTDFSAVRIHHDASADGLNRQIQAKAFTTGNDIFFGAGQYDPGTSAGQHLLAHELTHTVQQSGARAQRTPDRTVLPVDQIHRSAAIVQRVWPFDKKKPAPPATARGASDHAAYDIASEGYESAGDGREAQLHGVAASTAESMAVGGGAAAFGLASTFKAASQLREASKMADEAKEHGDGAMGKAAGRLAKDSGWGAGMGLAATGKGAAGVGQAISGAASTGAAAMAAAGFGIVTGGAMVLQGGWRGGQAVMKLCRLTWGRAQEVLTEPGRRWKDIIVGAEQFKLAINLSKIVAGALGITVGVLLIASNPVGWAVGIAAALTAGIIAGVKIGSKAWNAWDKRKAADALAAQIGSPTDVQDALRGGDVDLAAMGYDPATTRQAGPHNIVTPPPKGEIGAPTDAQDALRGGDVDLAAMGYDPTKTRKAGPQNIVAPIAAAPGTGFAEDRSGPDDPARQAAIDAADALARAASANARTASEMRDALSHGSKTTIQDALDAKANDPRISLDAVLDAADDRTLYDAFVLLSSINIDYDQALAASGQALIQSKLSKADSM